MLAMACLCEVPMTNAEPGVGRSRITALWNRRIGYPLVPVALLYTSGILLGLLIPVPLGWLFGGCTVALSSWCILHRHQWWWQGALAALLILGCETN